MPMPNRNVEGNYRYGYQGEYAEKEPELGQGINSFQLRLYDSRIGRWISPDPMGQYHSPYMAMDNRPNMSVDPTGGCTTVGGRDCVFSVMGGTATDAGGNVWSGAGDIASELHTPFQLNEVVVGDTSGYLYYVNIRGGTNHSLLLDPETGYYWEASHPILENGESRHGGLSKYIDGNEKSIIRRRNTNDGDFWTKDSYQEKRGNIEIYSVFIPNKAAAIDYANKNVGDYPYKFTHQNCKHFVLDAMNAGHANVPNSTALPREFTKPGQSYWFGTTPPDLEISNPNN
jgi:RHS repeat-associated protein